MMHSNAVSDVTLQRDVPCIKCGYNLRGLPRDRNCPECGTPVTRSAPGDLLSAADPAWLSSVYRGQSRITIAGVLLLVTVPVVIAIDTLFDSFLDTNPPVRRALGLVPWLLCLGLLSLGIIRVTTRDPRLTLTEQPVVLRRMTRMATFLTLWLCIAYNVADPVLQPAATAYSTARAIVGWAFFLGLVATAIAASHYLGRLAERVPDTQLADKTKLTAKRFGILVLVLLVVELIAWAAGYHSAPAQLRSESMVWVGLRLTIGLCDFLVFVYALALMDRWWAFRKVLRRCLLEARAHEEQKS